MQARVLVNACTMQAYTRVCECEFVWESFKRYGHRMNENGLGELFFLGFTYFFLLVAVADVFLLFFLRSSACLLWAQSHRHSIHSFHVTHMHGHTTISANICICERTVHRPAFNRHTQYNVAQRSARTHTAELYTYILFVIVHILCVIDLKFTLLLVLLRQQKHQRNDAESREWKKMK